MLATARTKLDELQRNVSIVSAELKKTQANLKQIQKDFDERQISHTKLVRNLRDEIYRIGNEKETYSQNIKVLKNQLTFKEEEIDDAERKLKEYANNLKTNKDGNSQDKQK